LRGGRSADRSKKAQWGSLSRRWVPADVRAEIVSSVAHWHERGEIAIVRLLEWIGLPRNRYYDWVRRNGEPNRHNGTLPKTHWILTWEKEAILAYAAEHLEAGYRRLTWLMNDEDIVAVSPSTTYRVLSEAGLLRRWNREPSRKGRGFEQPLGPHEHWHIDFAYIKLGGTFYFLATVLDGCSRAVLAWRLSENMTDTDAEIVLQKARETYPGQTPRIISDNGPQFLSKDFKEFIRICEMSHVRTAPYYPQSNGKLERFHRTVKGEGIRPNAPADVEDARRILAAYIDDYNEVCLHGAVGYLPPMVRLRGEHEAWQKRRRDRLARARQERRDAAQEENRFSSPKEGDTNPLPASQERCQEIPQAPVRETRTEPRTVLDAEREAGPEAASVAA